MLTDRPGKLRKLFFQRLVLIYQMPKVGSQTIEATLDESSFPYRVVRLHYLSRAFAKTLRHGLGSPVADPAWKSQVRMQLDSLKETSRLVRLRRMLIAFGFRIPRLEIITGVRELVGLVLASIFENHLYFSADLESLDVEACREALLHPKTFKTLRDWFDLELKTFTGIDVFRYRFPRKDGCAVYENRFARVLVYRFEALPHMADRLRRFLGCEIPALTNRNLGDHKTYADRYRHIKGQLRLPAKFVSTLYQCKMMQHFYSPEELNLFQSRWSEPQLETPTRCWPVWPGGSPSCFPSPS